MNTQNDYAFESFDNFINWLNKYSSNSNQQFFIFSFRKHDTVDKEFNYVHYKCIHHKYAFTDSNGTVHSKLTCPAKIKVSYRNKGNLKNTYQVTDFNIDHNHELKQDTYTLNKQIYSESVALNDLIPRIVTDQSDPIVKSSQDTVNMTYYPHSNSNYSASNSSFDNSISYQYTPVMNNSFNNQHYYQMNDFNYTQLYQTMQQLTQLLMKEKSNEKLNMICYMKYLWENNYQFNIEPVRH